VDSNDTRRSAIRHTISALASGRIDEVEAFAAITGAIEETPREAAAAARQSRRERMLAEYWRLEPKLWRSTATRVARKFARDPLDPIEVRNLATALRRWVAEEKRTVCVCSTENELETEND
jgi:hypothetical protein